MSVKRVIFFALLLLLPLYRAVADNTVRSVNVEVRLDSLGNARICETWNVNIDSNNTEWFLSLSNLGRGRVGNLSVQDMLNGLEYRTLEHWDVDRTREQKAGLCGIVEKSDDDFELCWGVTSGGDHLWKVSYDYKNLITSFTDSCAFNHMFISDELSPSPARARVEISFPGREITDSIASIWSFGYDGYVAYRDGVIVAESDGALHSGEGIIVMAAFDKGLFRSDNQSTDSFSVMKDRAFEGSDYVGDEPLSLWDIVLLVIVLPLLLLVCIALKYAAELFVTAGLSVVFFIIVPVLWSAISLYPLRVYLKRRRLLRSRPYTRDLPKGFELNRIPYILSQYSYDILSNPERWNDNITAAYLMRLIADDALYIDKTAVQNGKKTPLLHVRENWQITPDKYSGADSAAMNSLYMIIKNASGVDFILQEGELKAYRKSEGMSYVKDYYKRRKISGFKPDESEAVQILGLQAFFKDFTLLSERDIPEMALWNEYLVYATAFGLADRVIKTMKKVAPDYPLLDKVCDESGVYLLESAILRDVSRGMDNVYERSRPKSESTSYGGYTSRSSGGGGRSSHHGGGGHSGGGRGGGR